MGGFDDEQIDKLQPVLAELNKSGTVSLDIIQEYKGKHYRIWIERQRGEAPEGTEKVVDRDGLQPSDEIL